jgi:hypothetical protein
MTPLVTPPEVRLVLTREAAKVLGCSMRHVRTLAFSGAVKSWSLGPKSSAFDFEELQRRKVTMDERRKAGKVQGAPPRGFSADIGPLERAKRQK